MITIQLGPSIMCLLISCFIFILISIFAFACFMCPYCRLCFNIVVVCTIIYPDFVYLDCTLCFSVSGTTEISQAALGENWRVHHSQCLFGIAIFVSPCFYFFSLNPIGFNWIKQNWILLFAAEMPRKR